MGRHDTISSNFECTQKKRGAGDLAVSNSGTPPFPGLTDHAGYESGIKYRVLRVPVSA